MSPIYLPFTGKELYFDIFGRNYSKSMVKFGCAVFD